MALADVRDVAIIVLAIESIVVGILLMLLLWQMRSLTRLLEEEIQPMLDNMQETIGRVKGTTSLVSETIVSPAVRLGGFAAGLRRALEVMLATEPPEDREGSAQK
jgi:hypothetical protein